MRRSICLIGLAAFLVQPARAQAGSPPDLRSPLPSISFENWRETGSTDTSDEYGVAFPSAYTSPYPANNTVDLRIFVPKERRGPVPVVVILHYWGARDLKVERALADQLTGRGIAAVIVPLPYHLTRTPPGYRSGELAIRPNPDDLRATMTQAAMDVKRTVDFLITRPEFDSSKIGVAGTSLGALVSALSYGVESRFSRAAFVLGGADLAQIMWTSSRVVEARDSLRRQGYTVERLRAELAPVEPLTYLGSRRNDSAFIIGGRFDTVIPRASTQALIEAFQSPQVLWLDTGHYGGIFVQSRILKEVANYFQEEFQGKAYAAPRRIYVPTLRIGVQASTSSGFDIGVGIDLWKSNRKGDFCATGLLTPRGPQIFVGGRISNGLSLGVVGAAGKVGVGLFWSRIL